jgi:hypothetical protein
MSPGRKSGVGQQWKNKSRRDGTPSVDPDHPILDAFAFQLAAKIMSIMSIDYMV